MGTSGLNKKTPIRILSTIITLIVVLTFTVPASAVAVPEANFLYTLSDFTGPFIVGWCLLAVDKERNETYVVYQNVIRVFNENGMEIYRFNEDNSLGRISALAVDRDGTIFLLSYDGVGTYGIIRCNYRGEPTGRIEITGLSPDLSNPEKFSPTHMEYRKGQFYLADTHHLRIAIADMNGQVKKTYDVIPLLELKEKDRADNQMGGFSVDDEGNMLFTMPEQFSASVLSPEGKVLNFGQGGSIPGKFGVVAGIVPDNKGHILVADKLRCVVIMFDRKGQFLMEFGERGNELANLIIPDSLVLDSTDKLYVTQGGNRGISVFRLVND